MEQYPPTFNPRDALDALPASLSVGQGQETLMPLLDAFELRVEVSSLELSAEYDVAGKALKLFASYTAVTPITVKVSAGEGATSLSKEIAVSVRPLRWLPPIRWGADGPEAREHAAMVPFAADRKALLFGGSGYRPYLDPLADAWSFDLDAGTWSAVIPEDDPPGGGASRRVAMAPGANKAYLFGGYGYRGMPNADLYRVELAGGSFVFTKLAQENAPPPRALHAFVFDAATDRFLLFGGVGMQPLADVWTMRLIDGTAVWTQQAVEGSPSPRYGFFYGFDAERGRLLVFSGAQSITTIDVAHDTWVLDVRAEPPVWAEVCQDSPTPRARRNGCAVFDPGGPRLFVFGGTADGRTTQPGLFALDARPGHEAWSYLELAGEPPPRSSGFGIYDAATQCSYMGFGNTSGQVFQDWTALGD